VDDVELISAWQPNANIVTDVPGVNLEWELSVAIGVGS
jgi:hypothetical protein